MAAPAVHASRLRIGMAVVALLHPLFWLGRHGADPNEDQVEWVRLLIVIGAVALIRFSYRESAVRRWGHLLRLISDMLDLTRLESGTAVIEVEPTDVAPVVEEVRRLTEVLATAKGLQLVVTADPALVVLADRPTARADSPRSRRQRARVHGTGRGERVRHGERRRDRVRRA